MAPTTIACESEIERVVVYARGAVVERRVALPADLPDGAVDLLVPGLTALADAGSVRARCEGEREVEAVEARLAIPDTRAPLGELYARVRAVELEAKRLDAERRDLDARREALAQMTLDPAMTRWARRLDPAARFADARALGGLVHEELGRLDALVRASDEAREQNRRALSAARLAAAQGTPAETAGEGRARLAVRVRLGGKGAVAALAIEYVVGAARWWPAYTARFSAAATKVALGLDAFVAQATGEDWARVRLALSTADLATDARLPELPSLRLGRAQPAPRRGYRPPPAGLDALFEGYDRAAAPQDRRLPPPPPAAGRAAGAAGARSIDFVPVVDAIDAEEDAGAFAPSFAALPVAGPAPGAPPQQQGFGAPPPMKARRALAAPSSTTAPAPSAAPMAVGAAMPARAKSVGRLQRFVPEGGASLEQVEDTRAGGGGAFAPEPEPPAAIEPADAWLDFDTLVLADPADKARRGRLVREPAAGPAGEAEDARARIDAAEGPPLARDPRATRGRFDHRYDAEGTADVPASGRPHRVSLAAAETFATPRFVAVPREAPEVYREAEIKNPFGAPLLAGPVDVFLDGALMTTTELAPVDRSGRMFLGLGVEDRLRVARNARVEETTAGLLGGSAVIDHAVTVELASSLGHDASVDVLERVPVTDEKDVEVKVTHARPEPEKYAQTERGSPLRRGLRFRIDVPAGKKARIEWGYRVTLPAKNEVVGGNRRE